MLSLWEVLKTSKGLPAPDGFTALFARSLSDTYTLAEISGIPPLNLGEIVEIVDYTIYGNTYQSDGVSPDTPQEVVGVGERTGNLIPYPYYSSAGTINGVTFTTENTGRIMANGTATGTVRFYLMYDQKLKAGTYTLSVTRNAPMTNINLQIFDSSKGIDSTGLIASIGNSASGFAAKTFSLSKDTNILLLYAKSGLTETYIDEYVQLEAGDTANEYEPYGYKVDVVSRGKNLFDIRTITENAYLNGGTGLTGDSQYSDASDFIMVIGEKITISATLSGDLLATGTRDICFYNSSKVLMKSLTLQSDLSQSVTIAVPEGAAYVRFAYDKSCTNIQLELGTEATSYEPYHEPITTPIYLDFPLYKIGDYADNRGISSEIRAIGELVLTGEETVNIFSNAPIAFSIRASGMLRSERKGICTHFAYQYSPGQSVKDGVTFGDLLYFTLSSETASRLGIIAQDTSSFKSYLAAQYANGTPVTVYYVLAEPESRAVEPVEIPTLDGNTVIDVDTEVKPSNLKITYKSKM